MIILINESLRPVKKKKWLARLFRKINQKIYNTKDNIKLSLTRCFIFENNKSCRLYNIIFVIAQP